MEAIDQEATTTSHQEENIVVESRDQFTSYTNPLVQQPLMANTSFHPHMEGHTDSPAPLEYGPDAPSWRTSMGWAIASFWVNRPSLEQYSPGEEEYRQIQASIHRAHDFQEIMHRLHTILATPIPHKEPLSALLPCNTNPWPLAEIKPSSDGHPTYGETSRNLGQTSNSTHATLSSRSVSTHPILSMAGGKP